MTMPIKRTEKREKPQMVPEPVRGQPALVQGDATWGAVRPTKSVAYVMLALAGLVGGGGLLAFMLFLFAGPLKLVNLGLGESPGALVEYLSLSGVFHST